VRDSKAAESDGAVAQVLGALPSSDLFNKTKVTDLAPCSLQYSFCQNK
jgi:hypothetical protein